MIAAVRIDYFLLHQLIVPRLVRFELQMQMFFASQALVVVPLGNFEGLIETPWQASVACISEMANM